LQSSKNIYLDTVKYLKKGGSFALATIVETWGSTPQAPGASALFSKRGLLLGTLGGGAIEAEAHRKAVECLKKSFSSVYEGNLMGEVGSEEALCGGRVQVLIDATPSRSLRTFELLLKSLHSRRAGVLTTRILQTPTGKAFVQRSWWEAKQGRKGLAAWKDSPSLQELEDTLRQAKPRLVRLAGPASRKDKERLFFLEPLFPLPQLVIVGAGHIGQALAPLGKRLDFEVTVIDDRPDFANAVRFPEADVLIVDQIERAVRNFPVSSDTYIVIVTRGHRYDAEALRACIGSPARYIGMIGSSRKVSIMRREFLEKGWASAAEFDRVRAPIGLKIGSKTVEEIAVSIAAELVLVRSEAGGKSHG